MYFWFLKVIVKFSHINEFTKNEKISRLLEILRNKILELSNQNLFYPVNPTSRNDAFVGGTLSCNASGFIPGNKGATRYWVKEIEFLLPNGNYLSIKKGEHIFRYGQIIGISTKEIHPGKHVHSHNLTFSEFDRNYDNDFSTSLTSLKKSDVYFQGYKRNNG